GATPAQGRLPRRGGGWLLLHASLLGGDAGQVAVVIEPARQTHLADVLVRAYALTAGSGRSPSWSCRAAPTPRSPGRWASACTPSATT
ncbi:hypothetical protein AB0J72_58635, partial [Dactylosporangium sp. NPDC049742]|uniref:hypothetical protein n=1 Tax=Dactylosporangium sp. NPDC049742 TaxID=3154737 RepID=UPI003435F72E